MSIIIALALGFAAGVYREQIYAAGKSLFSRISAKVEEAEAAKKDEEQK